MTTQQDLLFDICANRHRGNANSITANERKRASKDLDRERIVALLRRDPGLTCDDAEERLGLSHQTCSARFSELKRAGAIRAVGTKPTRTGSPATTWEAVS